VFVADKNMFYCVVRKSVHEKRIKNKAQDNVNKWLYNDLSKLIIKKYI